jgi:hypothetical protein
MLNPKSKIKMANYTTNEESLLTYLEELKEQTLSSVRMEEKTLNFWVSGEYKEYVDSGDITKPTNHQVDFYITNCENRLNPLRFRLNWLESQIKQISELKLVA